MTFSTSTKTPTVAEDDIPESTMLPPELTIIVAASRNMGIGRAGGLPWTGLKKEMAYFARVTKRIVPRREGTSDVDHIPSIPVKNALIMGRKTWDSIPLKFRPLKGRLNIALSRSYSSPPIPNPTSAYPELLQLPSLPNVLSLLTSSPSTAIREAGFHPSQSRVFVIGGAEIYKLALGEKSAKRILLTRILDEVECDAFFPVRLDDAEEGGVGEGGWKKKSKEELDSWVGETVPAGVQEEAGVKYLFEMWQRE